ncbi:MAG: hypothetical protein M3357_14150 [Actinomycetota bacterium]|nr:hypothetical protein [Actinomycetota bacterium]
MIPLVGSTPVAQAVATAEPDETWVTNGDVYAVVQSGGRIYLGGRFDQVGPNTGFGVPLDPARGTWTAGFPKVNGEVYVAVPDDSGGWFIGGDFTRVGDKSRQNAARILADGTVGPWNPNTDFPVRAIVLSRMPGSNVAYIGGDFTVLRETTSPFPAFGLAATNFYTGAPLWGLSGSAGVSVSALALSPDGSRLYVGGTFTTLGGVSRNHLAAVDAASGDPAPTFNPAPDGPVAALGVAGDGRIYAGGRFTRLGGSARRGLAVLATDGSPDPTWGISADGDVTALAFSADNARVFVGGAFGALGGQPRARLAVVSTVGAGSVDPDWNPGADGQVAALGLSSDGDRLWVGGSFTTVGGVARRYLAALDAARGTLDTGFDARPGAAALTVAASDGRLFAGGLFTSVNGKPRTNLAALDATTGALDAGFVADTDGGGSNQVNALVAEGAKLYVGGTFIKVNGVSRPRVARLDAATGAVDGHWRASIDAEVKTLALAGMRLYLGGSFTSVNGVGRNRLAALGTAGASLEGWDPNLDSAAYDLRLSPDQTLVYVVGNFSTVGGLPRPRLAAISIATGTATSWSPRPGAALRQVAVSGNGATVYVAAGGSRSTGNRIQAFSAASGSLRWQQLGDGDFTAVDVSGSLVYVGGHFTQVNGQVRGHLAAFDLASGALQEWAPPISGVHGVLDVVVTESHILIAGEFRKVNRAVQQGFARFRNDEEPPAATTTTTSAPAITTTTTTAPPAPTSTTTGPTTTTTTAPPAPTGTTTGPSTTTTTSPRASIQSSSTRSGYWMVSANGAVYTFGDAPHLGNGRVEPGVEAVDLEPTPSGRGYWVVDGAGGVSGLGDATVYGHADRSRLASGETITSLSATVSGRGYWLFTTRGRVLAFGDASFLGDMAAVRLNAPVLDSIPTPSGRGYYMVASDGGIFAFGDAHFHGSMGGVRLNAPVQSLVPDGDGVGYWLVASDGGIFSFEAPFRGSMGNVALNRPVTGMVRFGDGYLMVGEDGGIFNFSSLPFRGSLGERPPARPIVSVAALAR